MSEIIIKDEKTPTRCEICHKTDAFIPDLNSCFRCDNIEVNDVDDVDDVNKIYDVNNVNECYGQTANHHNYPYYQQVQTANQQYQSLASLGNGDNTYNSFATSLNRPANNLMLNNIIQFPSLADRQPKTTVKKYRPFPKPKPKLQPSIFFNFVMCVGMVMAILLLFSLFLTR
jgi:hypothetical protein